VFVILKLNKSRVTVMTTQSLFDPDRVDPEFYAHKMQPDRDTDPSRESDHDVTNRPKDASEGDEISDEASQKLHDLPQNPSDEALFSRADATYLEQDDIPADGYDPHNKGYDRPKAEK
jgi:hypothetical protein